MPFGVVMILVVVVFATMMVSVFPDLVGICPMAFMVINIGVHHSRRQLTSRSGGQDKQLVSLLQSFNGGLNGAFLILSSRPVFKADKICRRA